MYRLLIVDDEKDICENIKYLIDWERYGVDCIMTANTFESAIDIAVDFQPHMALVDISLNDGHWGYDLVEHLRSVCRNTVICMISGFDDFSYVQRSMKAGAKDYLLKPIDVRELTEYLEHTIVNDLHGTLPNADVPSAEIDPVLCREYSQFSKITNKIILTVKSSYRSSLSLTNIAEIFHMSSKYIGRIFLRDTGLKFSEYLMVYRMLMARNLIVNTKEKISAIASSVGYSQINNFYVHFKSYFNVSPSSLRRYSSAVGADEPEEAET